ncbi:MAG TPA: HlyD family type I secretion periplasmic adaptor subunit [Burkholderiales bacterium]|nr:HlyD family type I secretion periplasmic adaptor subunit [Burkholderiales bacterium]
MRIVRDADPADFQPALLQVQTRPPAPLGRGVLYAVFFLTASILVWSTLARLDIVATAEGKLVPAGYLKIVQPSEQGQIREIFVQEGQVVREGEVLMRMDTALLAADGRALSAEYHAKRLALRRIDAQLGAQPLARHAEDPPALFAQAQAQYAAYVAAHENALAQERSVLERARHDLAAAREVHAKLTAVLPHYREQEKAFEKLTKDGFTGRLMYSEKQRERIEKEQDLKSQEHAIAAARATIAQSEKRLAQIGADYRRGLQAERAEAAPQAERLREELAKQQHRHGLLELRAPHGGTVKDLATHTPGTVVAPGTILMTIVPVGEKLRAEVWVSNDDIGFVHVAQRAKIKLASFQFQKYGMVQGTVAQVSADSTEAPNPNTRSGSLAGRDRPVGALAFRTLVDLEQQQLESDGHRYALAPGMQVLAEIHLGDRTVLEYLLSPVRKAFHEAGRER